MTVVPNRSSRVPRARNSALAQSGELRLAAIDVGSNSIHMVIAQVDPGGGISLLWRNADMVGLGRNSFPSHRLSRQAIERALMTLRRFVSEAQRWQCEHLIAIATSAVHVEENDREFIEEVRSG